MASGVFEQTGERQDISIRRGVDFRLLIDAVDENGVAVDLTGATLSASIKADPCSTSPLAVFTGTPGPDANQYALDLPHEQSALLPQAEDYSSPGQLFWDAKLVWPDGRIDPVYYGYVFVLPEITV